MADFRKLFLALIAGALLFTAVASAQINPYSCTPSAAPTLGRYEGLAELSGDVLLTCLGNVANPGAGILVNIRYRLTQNITSDLESGSTTEALLILDEGSDVFRGYTSAVGTQNVYQARRIDDDEIEWAGVWLAGPNSASPFRTIRLTNVRANARGAGVDGAVFGVINFDPPTSVPLNGGGTLRVMDVRDGLDFSVDDVDFKNCVTPSSKFELNFEEGYAGAFKPRGTAAVDNVIPGGAYRNESGFYPPTTGPRALLGTLTGSPGQANQGTRLMARLTDIPDGVDLSVPNRVTTTIAGNTGLIAQFVEDPESDGSGGTVTTGTGSSDVPSSGLVVYEVVDITADSFGSPETVTVEVTADFDIPGPLGTAKVKGSFAPLPDDEDNTVMSDELPEPRFAEDTSDPEDAFSVNACRSILLFPFVTNQAGFDTGISIANTTADPLGTTAQAGTCTLNYYGNTGGSGPGPAAQTTPSVGAGGHFAMILSGGGSVFPKDAAPTACASGACVAPLFQGYIIAICNFQLAHGFAYVSDVQNDPSGRTLGAMGYLALIIPDRGDEERASQDSALSSPNDGEGLGN